MRLSAQRWITATGFLVLYGCALFQAAPSVIYRDDLLTVSIEPNPAGAGQPQREKNGRRITSQQLAGILKGLIARKEEGLIQSVIARSQPEPVFQDDELPLVARELSKGLLAASSDERVAFQLRRGATQRSREETSGALYLRGGLLYVTLIKFRVSDRLSYEGAEGGSGADFELLYEPEEALVRQQKKFPRRWLGGERPEVIVDTQWFTGPSAVGTPGADTSRQGEKPASDRSMSPPDQQEVSSVTRTPSVPDTEPMDSLRRQVKALTESNLDLRAKLKALQVQQEQFQGRSAAASEELTRLRHELAETKQLLADKVLELNRLKSKSKGSSKGKPQGSPGP